MCNPGRVYGPDNRAVHLCSHTHRSRRRQCYMRERGGQKYFIGKRGNAREMWRKERRKEKLDGRATNCAATGKVWFFFFFLFPFVPSCSKDTSHNHKSQLIVYRMRGENRWKQKRNHHKIVPNWHEIFEDEQSLSQMLGPQQCLHNLVLRILYTFSCLYNSQTDFVYQIFLKLHSCASHLVSVELFNSYYISLRSCP